MALPTDLDVATRASAATSIINPGPPVYKGHPRRGSGMP